MTPEERKLDQQMNPENYLEYSLEDEYCDCPRCMQRVNAVKTNHVIKEGVTDIFYCDNCNAYFYWLKGCPVEGVPDGFFQFPAS